MLPDSRADIGISPIGKQREFGDVIMRHIAWFRKADLASWLPHHAE